MALVRRVINNQLNPLRGEGGAARNLYRILCCCFRFCNRGTVSVAAAGSRGAGVCWEQGGIVRMVTAKGCSAATATPRLKMPIIVQRASSL